MWDSRGSILQIFHPTILQKMIPRRMRTVLVMNPDEDWGGVRDVLVAVLVTGWCWQWEIDTEVCLLAGYQIGTGLDHPRHHL